MGHQPPVAVTSKFLVSGGNERLVFGNQIDRENFQDPATTGRAAPEVEFDPTAGNSSNTCRSAR